MSQCILYMQCNYKTHWTSQIIKPTRSENRVNNITVHSPTKHDKITMPLITKLLTDTHNRYITR